MTPPDGTNGMHEDVLEARLRRALNAEADSVRISGDGLRAIQAGIQQQGSAGSVWWRRPAVALVAAALLGLVAGGVGVLLSQDDDGGGGVANKIKLTTGAPTGSTPTTTPSATSAPPTSSASGGQTITVPVYYLADSAGDLRLYREFHRIAFSSNKGRAAVVEMLRDDAVDPDYSSLWPTGTKVLGYSTSGGTTTVNLSKEASGPVNAGSQGAERSLQQLVYTVQAAEQDATLKVRLLVEGKQVTDFWGAANVKEPLTRAPAIDVRGWVWITAPVQGSTVASPVTVSMNGGYGFEGNVVVKFFRNGTEVSTDAITFQSDAFVDRSRTYPLTPGSWEVRAYQDNGVDASLALRDSKAFTVK
jgi:spore germination protein GerM